MKWAMKRDERKQWEERKDTMDQGRKKQWIKS